MLSILLWSEVNVITKETSEETVKSETDNYVVYYEDPILKGENIHLIIIISVEFFYTLAPPTNDTPIHSRPDDDTPNIKVIIGSVLIIDYIIN